MNTLTIIVLAMLAAAAWLGWHKGFLRMLFSVGTVLISLILTLILAPRVENFLKEKTGLYDMMQEKYSSFLRTQEDDSYIRSLAENLNTDEEAGSRENFLSLIKSRETLEETAQDALQAVTDESKQLLAAGFAGLSVKAAAFLLTWIVTGILIRILLGVIRIIEKLPVIHGANKVAGLFLGSLIGLLLLWIFFALVTAGAATDFGSRCMKQIADSPVLSAFYRHNFILNFF